MRTKSDQQEVEIQAIRRMERVLDELPSHRRLTILDFVRGRLIEESRLGGDGASYQVVPAAVNGA